MNILRILTLTKGSLKSLDGLCLDQMSLLIINHISNWLIIEVIIIIDNLGVFEEIIFFDRFIDDTSKNFFFFLYFINVWLIIKNALSFYHFMFFFNGFKVLVFHFEFFFVIIEFFLSLFHIISIGIEYRLDVISGHLKRIKLDRLRRS